MKKETLLEKSSYLQAVKSKRLHFITTAKVAEEIDRYAKEFAMCKSDVIVLSALAFQVADIMSKLDTACQKLRIPVSPTEKRKKQIENWKEENVMAKETVEMGKVAQFHLRVTPEAYEEIKKRASAFGLSISDYVAFVTLRFDIMEISAKLDEINAKLDKN